MVYRVMTCFLLAAALLAMAWPERAETKGQKKPVIETDEPVVQEIDNRPHSYNLGQFELTAYCACPICCGKATTDPGYGITASGTTVKQGRTVAVDPGVIPLGSVIYIQDGTKCTRYVAEDTGGAIKGNKIDIYFDSHEQALEFGVQTATVWIWR